MQLYDMHSHILPGIDDGAPSVEKSLVILNELKKQGITNVCLTPHFYTNEISAEDFAAKRQHKNVLLYACLLYYTTGGIKSLSIF